MTEPAAPADDLRASLLHGEPAPSERQVARRWSYPKWGVFVVSLFIAYHAVVLLVWNLPSKGIIKDYHKAVMDTFQGQAYFNGTRNTQSWAMFAPDPNRSNAFIMVYVQDQDGNTWNYGQDIWGSNRYPYFFYDRRGKINRRIDGKKHFQRIYGAWVCREWERQHEGVPAKSVSFIRRSTRVPLPREVIKRGGWDPWGDHYKQKEQETITCKTTPDAQLPNELRVRYGLPEVDETLIRRTEVRTWVDTREAERKRAEREAALAERGLAKPASGDESPAQGGNVEEQDEY